jgi:YidC/Oxa1 family membrane protein insertase
MLVEVYNFLFLKPISKFLSLSFSLFKDFGLSIFFLTFFLRILLFPLNLKIYKEQKKFEILSQKLKEIQKKHKNDKEKLIKETMAFLKKEKINLLPSYFLLLIQIPIFLAIYQSLKDFSIKNLPLFLGILDLTKPNFTLAALAGVLNYLQISSSDSFQIIVSVIASLFLVFIFSQLASGISLYFIFMLLFNFVEKKIFLKFFKI